MNSNDMFFLLIIRVQEDCLAPEDLLGPLDNVYVPPSYFLNYCTSIHLVLKSQLDTAALYKCRVFLDWMDHLALKEIW